LIKAGSNPGLFFCRDLGYAPPMMTRVSKGAPADTPGAFFGRRKGKALRPGQADYISNVLPRLMLPEGPIDAPASLFNQPTSETRLEIGFGGGEHLIAAMRANPQIGFIGCEPFINGMAKFLAQTDREGLTNMRLWDADASLLLPRLPAQSLAQVDLFYPDPWPKRRQRKRRFVSPRTLREIARVLKPGGLFRFASDIDDYVGWTLVRVLAGTDFIWEPQAPDDWRKPYQGWVRTRYEAKAVLAGRVPSYLTFVKQPAIARESEQTA
jgi:tRNA (guanine-N7-)-methyltransferase